MEKQLTAKEKRDSNFCDAQRMIYYDLPVLVSKIFHAALINCEYGSPVMCIEDLKFIQGFIEETPLYNFFIKRNRTGLSVV